MIEERDNVKESRWTVFPKYEVRAREINRNLLKETRDRESRIERARKEEKTWELIRLCTSFFDDHCDTWQKNTKERASLREKEEKREERKRKANLEKLTFKVGYAQKRINTFLRKLPENERRNFESEEDKKRRKRLKEIKETMWKRSRMEGEQLQTKYETNLQSLEDRLETLETLYKKCEEEEKQRMEKMEEEKRERKEKRQKKSERLLQKSKLEEKWAMMRWLIKYIEENQEQWRVDREIRQNEMTGEIIEEKITTTPNGENNEISEERKWEIWREKARERNIRRKQEPVRVALLNLEKEKGNMSVAEENLPNPQNVPETNPVNTENICLDGCETGLQDKVGNMSVPGLSATCPETHLSEPEQGSAGDNGVTELSEKVPVYNAENPSVAVLSESETDEQVIRKFRKEVDEMVLRLEVKPSGKLLRTMKKFDDKLEAAVSRMAILGCIDEEESGRKEKEKRLGF